METSVKWILHENEWKIFLSASRAKRALIGKYRNSVFLFRQIAVTETEAILNASSSTYSAFELCFCDRAVWEGCFGQLYNGRTGTPARPMHRSQQPIRIGYTELVIESVITVYGPSCTFLELIFPWLSLSKNGTYMEGSSIADGSTFFLILSRE